ncbi:right-handed parallel beta-helix repeat-containing protein [Streptomyces sp. NA04227]|uniref:right-handed parallel beta-helix repeat-containing protein n=1 Tax=Streptomyces sp. NA04227 TaxID=2742136 RepID=UPI0020CA4A4C|nr:right-handed parallel beta-helix repeat-containing protein [Streptomyces sp. NA04227]
MPRPARPVSVLLTVAATTLAAWLPTSPAASADDRQPPTVYAAPDGSGTICSAQAPCSLEGARAKVRGLLPTATTDLNVLVSGGSYPRTEAFVLGPEDSGRDGRTVTWKARPGTGRPVLDAGRPVTGWTRSDDGRGIWSAPLPDGHVPRQLYADGERRPRAAGSGCTAAACPVSEKGVAGVSEATGVPRFAHPEDLEISVKIRWRNYRCGATGLNGATLELEQPCWTNARSGTGRVGPYWDSTAVDSAKYKGVAFFENAYELLDRPGEWFADPRTRTVHYMPATDGADPNRERITVPGTETLLKLRGTAADPVHDLRVSGLGFRHTSWHQPSTAEGYAGAQAGLTLTGATGPEDQSGRYYTKPAAAVTVTAGRQVTVSDGEFTHLGGAGIRLEGGTSASSVVRNRFGDLSSGAVYVGDTDPDPEPGLTAADDTVAYNVVRDTGVEFTDSVGIWAGYPLRLRVDHNTLDRLPYSGISVGWGWNQPEAQESVMRDNNITGNRLTNVMMPSSRQHDGGGIYTQGAQPGSVISGNYVNRSEYGGTERDGNGIYLDEQSSHFRVRGNVLTRVGGKWVSNWASYGIDNRAEGNWSDVHAPALSGQGSAMTGNRTGLTALPEEALDVARAAGAGDVREVERIGRDRVRGTGVSLTQSSTANGAAAGRAADADPFSNSLTTAQRDPYWQADLGSTGRVGTVEVVNQGAGPLADYYLLLSDRPLTEPGLDAARGQSGVRTIHVTGNTAYRDVVEVDGPARYVRVQLAGEQALGLTEVAVRP